MPETFTQPIVTPAAARSPRPPSTAVVSLMTDFGARDPSPGICRGVILSIAPQTTVIDLTHEIAKYRILDGALVLWSAVPHLPVGVHVAVVDPGVGTERLPIAIATSRGDVLVGPDNGLLVPAAERLGGIVGAHALQNPDFRLPRVSNVFHGRDIFSPAAAHLSLGVPLQAFGPPIEASALVRLDIPVAEVGHGELRTAVIYVDSFGNVKLAGETSDLIAAVGPLASGDLLRIELPGGHVRSEVVIPWTTTFGLVPPGELLTVEDSYGRLSIAVNQGSGAAQLGLHGGDRVVIRRA